MFIYLRIKDDRYTGLSLIFKLNFKLKYVCIKKRLKTIQKIHIS